MAQPWGLIIMLLMRKCQRPVFNIQIQIFDDNIFVKLLFHIF